MILSGNDFFIVMCPWIDLTDTTTTAENIKYITCIRKDLGCPENSTYYTDEMYKCK